MRAGLIGWVLTGLAAVSAPAFSQGGEIEGKRFAVAPLVLSNPTMGTGAGVSTSYLYQRDAGDPVSQLMGMAAYTDTDSWFLAGMNNGRYRGDAIRTRTGLGISRINNDFSGAQFASDTWGVFHQHLWQVSEHQYAGLVAFYMDTSYDPKNPAGAAFLAAAGVSDTVSLPVGLVYNFDTRDNQFYPMQGFLAEVETQSAFEDFGSDESFNAIEINLHHYQPVGADHVFASQLYGRYTEDGAPYSSLSYLGRRNVLRGFTAGEVAGEHLTAIQGEYRHTFRPRWKGVVFAGYADVGGPSANATGVDGGYASVGAGVRYAIQPEQGVHLRVDVAFGNDENNGFYFAIQEAF